MQLKEVGILLAYHDGDYMEFTKGAKCANIKRSS